MSTGKGGVGGLLRSWRAARGASQLDLALRAGVSARHVSFVESGRARPSRAMLASLADALDVPEAERGALLVAAGFAPEPAAASEAAAAASLAHVDRAADVILARLEPYPAAVLDPHWNVLRANAGALRFLALFFGPDELAALGPLHTVRLLFAPALRARVLNWDEVAVASLQRLHREALAGDAAARALLTELRAAGPLPAGGDVVDLAHAPSPVIPLEVSVPGGTLRLLVTITTLGTPHDVAVQALRLEVYLPADDATDAALRALAGAGG